MKCKNRKHSLPNCAWLILFPVFVYGILLLSSKIFGNIDFTKYLLWGKFLTLSSFAVVGGYFLYYILNFGVLTTKKNKKWHLNRITALCLTIFLSIILFTMPFTSNSLKEYSVVILGVVLGWLYVIRGGSLPGWLIEFTQKFNFYTGGTITKDNAPENISPRIYLPILLSAILIAILAYFVFV